MSACNRIKIRNRKLCIGNLKTPILILSRTLKSTGVLEVDYSENFETVADIFSAVQTNVGYESFNGVGTNAGGAIGAFTHKFYIRKLEDCDVTSENWIQYKGDLYKILRVENLDERDTFVILFAIKHGCNDLDANKA